MKKSGFTLVEVLIAATILFTSLAVVSESYRASLLASDKASRVAELLTPLPLILGHIQSRLLENPIDVVSGRGEVLGVAYEFEARSIKFGAPPRRVEPETGEYRTYPPRFRLYNVELSLNAGTQNRRFEYQELSWLPGVG